MLQVLPFELFGAIVTLLDQTSLSTLRLVSKDFDNAIFHFWAQHFSTMRIDLKPESLHRLQVISKTRSLGYHVRSLHIESNRNETLLERALTLPEPECWLRSTAIEQLKVLQALLCTDLNNCRSFCIEDSDRQAVALPSTSPASEVVWTLLDMIAEKGLKIQSFTLMMGHARSRDFYGRTCLCSPRLQCYPHLSAPQKFHLSWSHLDTLCLHQSVQNHNVAWICELIQKAMSLRKLFLDLYKIESNALEQILNLKLPALEEIYLESAKLTVKNLLKLLGSSQPTLRILHLIMMFIEHEDPKHTNEDGDCRRFFRSLRMYYPEMREIKMTYPWHRPKTDGSNDHFEIFIDSLVNETQLNNDMPDKGIKVSSQPRPRNSYIHGVSYKGKYFQRALQNLEKVVDR